MAVADAPSSRPPAPDECDHPAPVEGVMAHEFAHYEGAIGPEGLRRTVTYYGPVVGGLPIDAWHCEICGLLRLSFPDGRKEERRLFPGPQPGLLAAPTALAPETISYGMQARVSGLSVSASLTRRFAAEAPVSAPALQLPQLTLPEWDGATWLIVTGMSGVAVLLFLIGILSVYTYSTPPIVTPLAIATALTFAALIVFGICVAAVRHFFPAQPLRPSIAETARQPAVLDGVTRAVVALLVLSIIGLFIAGLLAVYTYSTPGAEGPILLLSLLAAVVAVILKVADAARRHFLAR